MSSDPTADAAGPIRTARDRVRQLDPRGLADELAVSEVLLRDILNSLARPGRDPREDFPAPVFRRGIVKLEDLQPGMTLSGTVLNVVDFGAFVDIGLPDSGLVHISRLADRFVRDPARGRRRGGCADRVGRRYRQTAATRVSDRHRAWHGKAGGIAP